MSKAPTIIEKIGWYTHESDEDACANADAFLRTLEEIRGLPELQVAR